MNISGAISPRVRGLGASDIMAGNDPAVATWDCRAQPLDRCDSSVAQAVRRKRLDRHRYILRVLFTLLRHDHDLTEDERVVRGLRVGRAG